MSISPSLHAWGLCSGHRWGLHGEASSSSLRREPGCWPGMLPILRFFWSVYLGQVQPERPGEEMSGTLERLLADGRLGLGQHLPGLCGAPICQETRGRESCADHETAFLRHSPSPLKWSPESTLEASEKSPWEGYTSRDRAESRSRSKTPGSSSCTPY